MRQAGRSLPEYRAARGSGSILDAIAQPELVADLTRQPVDRYGTDAAIFFSDIVVPAAAIGFGVDVAPGTGPVVAEPFAGPPDLQRLRPLEPEVDTPYVIEAVRLLADELEVPLIGFAGGPFTVASYLVEGGPSKNFAKVKALMHGDPGSGTSCSSGSATWPWPRCAPSSMPGPSAVQLFDSWAGILTPAHYRELVLPATQRLFAELATSHPGVPTILFGVGTGELLTSMAGAREHGDRRRLAGAARRGPAPGRPGPGRAGQPRPGPVPGLLGGGGGGDPGGARRRPAPQPGHVFNLGHGVLPETDPGILERVVDLVHAEGRAGVVARVTVTARARTVATVTAPGPARRRAGHGPRDPGHPRGHRALLHRHPARAAADPRAPRRAGGPVPGHRRDLAAHRADPVPGGGAGRRPRGGGAGSVRGSLRGQVRPPTIEEGVAALADAGVGADGRHRAHPPPVVARLRRVLPAGRGGGGVGGSGRSD